MNNARVVPAAFGRCSAVNVPCGQLLVLHFGVGWGGAWHTNWMGQDSGTWVLAHATLTTDWHVLAFPSRRRGSELVIT